MGNNGVPQGPVLQMDAQPDQKAAKTLQRCQCYNVSRWDQKAVEALALSNEIGC